MRDLFNSCTTAYLVGQYVKICRNFAKLWIKTKSSLYSEAQCRSVLHYQFIIICCIDLTGRI